MHEFSLVRSILETALTCSSEHGNRPVTKVTVRVGALRQVVPELMMFAFEAAREGTVAEGATLEWTEVPLVVTCTECSRTFTPDNAIWECPNCGGFNATVVQGDELILQSIELLDE